MVTDGERSVFYVLAQHGSEIHVTTAHDPVNVLDPESENDLVGTYPDPETAFRAICVKEGWDDVAAVFRP